MTCIIATINNGKVHMLGDRLGSNGFTKEIYLKNDKVFKVEDFIIGYTTSFRMGQILQYSWQPPKHSKDDSDDEYFYKHVISSLKKTFAANDFGHKDKTEFNGGNFLIGWKGRIFEIQDNLSALEYSNHASVGSGCYHAVAAMQAMKNFNILADDPESLMKNALHIAADCTTGVSKEYNYISE